MCLLLFSASCSHSWYFSQECTHIKAVNIQSHAGCADVGRLAEGCTVMSASSELGRSPRCLSADTPLSSCPASVRVYAADNMAFRGAQISLQSLHEAHRNASSLL